MSNKATKLIFNILKYIYIYIYFFFYFNLLYFFIIIYVQNSPFFLLHKVSQNYLCITQLTYRLS